jgi:hypothetical protein
MEELKAETRAKGVLKHCTETAVHCKSFRLNYSAKFGIRTVVGLNGTLVEDSKRRFEGEYEHFSFNKCPI